MLVPEAHHTPFHVERAHARQRRARSTWNTAAATHARHPAEAGFVPSSAHDETADRAISTSPIASPSALGRACERLGDRGGLVFGWPVRAREGEVDRMDPSEVVALWHVNHRAPRLPRQPSPRHLEAVGATPKMPPGNDGVELPDVPNARQPLVIPRYRRDKLEVDRPPRSPRRAELEPVWGARAVDPGPDSHGTPRGTWSPGRREDRRSTPTFVRGARFLGGAPRGSGSTPIARAARPGDGISRPRPWPWSRPVTTTADLTSPGARRARRGELVHRDETHVGVVAPVPTSTP